MDDSEITERLGRVQLFAGLDPKEVGGIVRSGRTLNRSDGTDMVSQGSQGHGFFMLLRGEADVVADDQVVARLGVGECFGESSLLTKAPRNATVRAVGDVEVFVLSAAEFRHQVKSNPDIALKLLEAMAARSPTAD